LQDTFSFRGCDLVTEDSLTGIMSCMQSLSLTVNHSLSSRPQCSTQPIQRELCCKIINSETSRLDAAPYLLYTYVGPKVDLASLRGEKYVHVDVTSVPSVREYSSRDSPSLRQLQLRCGAKWELLFLPYVHWVGTLCSTYANAPAPQTACVRQA